MDLRALFSLLTRISELFARSVVIGLLPLLLVALAKAEQPKPPVADGKPLLVAAEGKSQPEQKADGKLSVLFAFSSAGDPCSYEFAARLVHDGVEVNSRRESLAARSLTWDEVKPYNVLAVSGIGFANADGTLSGKDKQNLEIINRFLEAGGGIFFIPCWGQMDSQIPPQAAFLKPLGATPHFDEMVFDHEPMIRATASMASHPARWRCGTGGRCGNPG